jgi:hypothetical protein
MLFNALLITFILLITGCATFAALLRLSRCPYLTILDVQKVLRPVQSSRMQQLLDSRVESVVRPLFSRRKFEESQLMSLYEIREQLLRMSHNAFILLTWANTELWRETKYMPGMEDRELYMDLSHKLHSSAIEFRCYALSTLLRINFWMIFRIRFWSPFPAPRLADLREIGGVRFHASYSRLRETVGALCLAYGQEFYEQIMPLF